MFPLIRPIRMAGTVGGGEGGDGVGFCAAVFAGVLGFFYPLVEGVFAPVGAVRVP